VIKPLVLLYFVVLRTGKTLILRTFGPPLSPFRTSMC
jgi:hypothetical protein